ncbi:site-2 protease family protein [Alteraurantiacibacter aestuarii]|uniref:Site-2 protease family protein n=1 Tax=Alteraurantiacibacter aestuarii TaxID=650004 RepID=A0A844ZN01_9SPHN|nr:site-2 protease family protein [Alteraurantiacibacter aestuarii]MXO89033.1 site-2 protease family protein [Alteraurantiacibacter aestuarii]
MTDTIIQILLLVPALIVAIVFHEVAHGYVAMLLGDPTAKERRRLSLNPLRHVDPIGTLLVPGAMLLAGGPAFGWAKPVPVIKERLDNPRFGMMAVAAAGPGTNLLLALVGAIALGLFAPKLGLGMNGEAGYGAQALFYFILINIFLAVFNMLPIPPFDGSHIVEGLLPPSWGETYNRLRPFGMMFFFALVASVWFFPQLGILENTVGVPVNWLLEKYLGLAEAISGL